ncbi:hypothetical protein, partial [Microbacterium lacticum]|uniref:hypothetical protein n=1 Tax=Microbacterium lacticum TaxID=33885 RepID=UPI0019D66CBD
MLRLVGEAEHDLTGARRAARDPVRIGGLDPIGQRRHPRPPGGGQRSPVADDPRHRRLARPRDAHG